MCSALVVASLVACSDGADEQAGRPIGTTAGPLNHGKGNGKLGLMLRSMLAKGVTYGKAHKGMPKKLVRLRKGKFKGKPAVMVNVFIQASKKQILKLQKLGAKIHTVTSSGIITATVPLFRLKAMAALSGVRRIEAGKRVRKFMDVSLGTTGLNVPSAMRPAGLPHKGGKNVVVGVLDTGIDWNHADFRTASGATRVHAVWDQSDYGDANPPAGKSYGHEYGKTAIDNCINNVAGSYCGQADTDGHGTHVAGTAAGNGRASGYGTSQYQLAGVAPEATIVVVKFDFDGDRNSETSVIDGIDWIFTKAAALGMPAVVNLSLGTDFGPHDGSTLEERGINDLTGPGRIVVAAAGNPGTTGSDAWGNLSLWGYPLHGTSTVPSGGYSEITVEVPAGAAAGDYVFFTVWYEGGDTNQVQVITPAGKKYPRNFKRNRKNIWKTGHDASYYTTSKGTIYVANGGDQLGWGTNNGDNELYIELSDYDNSYAVAGGTWKIRIYDRGTTQGGVYHSWHGTSAALTTARPRYDGVDSNNTMTVGSPATAHQVIAIGAYNTRMGWEYKDLDATNGLCAQGTPCCQTYNGGALSYYDPFYVDQNSNTIFDHDFTKGGHKCYLDHASDTTEPYGTLAFFSARGPSRDGRIMPAVSAPGVGIVASLSADALAREQSMPPADT